MSEFSPFRVTLTLVTKHFSHGSQHGLRQHKTFYTWKVSRTAVNGYIICDAVDVISLMQFSCT